MGYNFYILNFLFLAKIQRDEMRRWIRIDYNVIFIFWKTRKKFGWKWQNLEFFLILVGKFTTSYRRIKALR